MNFTEINHALTQAINNLAEGEIDVAALAMAEDLEREELEEAKKRSGRKQKAIDKASYAKHGVKWRSTASGHRVAINKRGKVVGGNPFVLANLPKSALAKSAKKKAAKASKTKQINKMLGGKGEKKDSSAKGLRAQLAKAKKKMGKDFNAMLMQDMNLMGDLTEAWETPKKMSYWDGEDWYFVQKLRDSEIYFRPTKKLKNGNLKGVQVTRYLGERAQKAKLTSVFKLDFDRWQPVAEKDVEKPVLRRIKEKLDA